MRAKTRSWLTIALPASSRRRGFLVERKVKKLVKNEQAGKLCLVFIVQRFFRAWNGRG